VDIPTKRARRVAPKDVRTGVNLELTHRIAVDLKSLRNMVDVTGIEPVTPCLQSRRGKH